MCSTMPVPREYPGWGVLFCVGLCVGSCLGLFPMTLHLVVPLVIAREVGDGNYYAKPVRLRVRLMRMIEDA